MRRTITIFTLLMLLVLGSVPIYAADGETVYVIPIKGVISSGLTQQVERGIEEAEKMGAQVIVLDIDTPGGAINAARDISKMLFRTNIDTISFISGDALSAGALVSFSTKRIAMANGSTIGAAEPRLGNEKADEKIVSAWTAELREAAETRGRNGNIAAAMSDADISIPDLIEKGKLLTLTNRQAVDLGMADIIKNNIEAALDSFGYSKVEIVMQHPSTAEQLAQLVTHPFVSPVLLTLGMAGLVLEVFTMGFGVAGGIGLLSLALYFGGHYLAGFSGWEAIVLFVLGIIMMAVEVLIIPGFGVAGIGGMAMLLISIVLASTSVAQAVTSMAIALLGTIILLLISVRFLPTRKWWQRFILGEQQQRDTGYLAGNEAYKDYIHKVGMAISPLRPSGTVEIEGEPVDVVTDQGFIERGTKVKVIKVEGRRIVVRKHIEKNV